MNHCSGGSLVVGCVTWAIPARETARALGIIDRAVKRVKSMSKQEKEGLDCLFSRQDRRLVNVKFMRGKALTIAPEAFREEICSIVEQRDAGLTPTGPVHSGREPVDVRKLARDM